jgi:hypothetical protein
MMIKLAKRFCWLLILFVPIFVLSVGVGEAANVNFDDVLSKWSKTQSFSDAGNILTLTATLYSPEYIDAYAMAEAEKNLWTKDETEQFKYKVFKIAQVEEFIPIELKFEVKGSPLHMSPFDKQVKLNINGKIYKPAEYDPRFNFKLDGERTGMVYFPRFDEKGRDLLKNVEYVKLQVNSGISPAVRQNKDIEFVWNVTGYEEYYSKLLESSALKKMEYDRLLRRIAELNDKKKELQKQLEQLDEEIKKIEERLAELEG